MLIRNLILLASLIICTPLFSFGRTVVISDIDDTLKISHVRSLYTAAHAFVTEDCSFTGMRELYNGLKSTDNDINFFYLSNAPQRLMHEYHREFLAHAHYPQGEVITRSEFSATEHKLKHIRNILNKLKPDRVIMLGDNGERDIITYDQIVKEFSESKINFYQFIRIAYSPITTSNINPLRLGQIGFVSPIEIALTLQEKSIMTIADVQTLIDQVHASITNKSMDESYSIESMPFPHWQDCRKSYQWNWDSALSNYQGLAEIKIRIIERCQAEPYVFWR